MVPSGLLRQERPVTKTKHWTKKSWQSQLPVELEDLQKSLLKRIAWNRIDTQQIKQKTCKQITEGHPVTADGGFCVRPVVIDWL